MEAPDFFVEDLLDLSNGGDEMTTTDNFYDSVGNSTDSSTFTPVDSSNSSVSLPLDSHFSSALSLPYDDQLAELEWLSNFVEESFSCESFQKLQLIPHQPVNPNPNPNSQSSVPGKARSKRSRVAPGDWSTRLLMVAPPTPSTVAAAASSSSCSPSSGGPKKASSKRREGDDPAAGEVRRCLHCAAEKTPQWRTGPMGPKTLCNACGVRYKSGRLVPEYRPAASPTFVSTRHSNSHRKVVELRRQKDLQRQHHQQFVHHHHQSMMISGGPSNGGDDYLMHHHHHLSGNEYRHMI